MAETVVELRSDTKRYGRQIVLDGVDLAIRRGEFLTLLGPSGCGKTTILRLIAGFEAPTAGQVWLEGVDVTALPPNSRQVNTVFQSYALFPHLSVFDNVAFGPRLAGVKAGDLERRVRETLATVQLEDYAERRPSQLSGGQQQRVAIARAIVNHPSVLLLDEPLSALDRKVRGAMQLELKRLQHEVGITFVVVTHDQEEAMTLSTRVGLMNHGEIVQVGTPSEIYEYPISRFVAEFIGSVNTFEGKLIEDEPSYVRIQCDELEAPIYVDHGVSSAPGATVWAAIRPEKIQLSRDKPADADNWASGVVQDIAYMGDVSIYLIRLDSGKVVRVTQPNVYRHAEDSITWEERVYLHWHPTSPVVVTK